MLKQDMGNAVPESNYTLRLESGDVLMGKDSGKPFIALKCSVVGGPMADSPVDDIFSLQSQSLWRLGLLLDALRISDDEEVPVEEGKEELMKAFMAKQKGKVFSAHVAREKTERGTRNRITEMLAKYAGVEEPSFGGASGTHEEAPF